MTAYIIYRDAGSCKLYLHYDFYKNEIIETPSIFGATLFSNKEMAYVALKYIKFDSNVVPREYRVQKIKISFVEDGNADAK